MKILLVKPAPRLDTVRSVHGLVFLEPIELGYVAAAVPAGHDVKTLDLRMARRPGQAFTRTLRSYRPDVVGLSGYTHEARQVVALAGAVRRTLPGARVVVGGHHATVSPETYNVPDVDAIVRGEGCAPFRAVIEALAAGRAPSGIVNVMLPGADFDAGEAARLPVYPDLDGLPVPRRDLWDPAAYFCVWPSERHPRGQTIFPPVALVRSSFGCHMDCSFCVVPRLCRHRHMTRSPELVAEEIASVAASHIYFCDDETFLDHDHARRLAQAIRERGIRKHYFAWARSTSVVRAPELFRQWHQIGLDAVFLGFEAVTDEELQAISKHGTVADNVRAHETLREMGVAVQGGFMVRPDFGRAEFDRLRQTIVQMPPAQITLTVYTPSPLSPAWSAESAEFVCDPFDLHDCMHPLTPTVLPLKEFYEQFASLVWDGARKTPFQTQRSRIPRRDLVRLWWSATGYVRSIRKAYRDFPKELW
ncbi:MAG: radical SAM protein [Candidatus Brocadiaceae bacterium]|nr:radical SAM protein [Candidatus Brocadiaceae bacterium]